jgi:ABC-type transporter lipoprotein component MlaA
MELLMQLRGDAIQIGSTKYLANQQNNKQTRAADETEKLDRRSYAFSKQIDAYIHN